MKNKGLIAVLALLMALCIGAGATLAYLMDKTEDVVNTFTYGDVNIDLYETDTNLDEDDDPNTNTYKMIPGETIPKDPKVVVEADSEACWLFVKITKSANFDDFMTYAPASGWTSLAGVEGVYYRTVDAATAESGKEYDVLAGNVVTVDSGVTKAQLNALDAGGASNYPTLTFTAYAVQQSDSIADATAAWGIANS